MSAQKNLVTVAIPTYNRPELLRRAIESVARQTYKNFELLVVDNASEKGDIQRIVDEYRTIIPNLIYERHQSNIGAQRNFLYCLQRACGEFFMWLADDDEISPGFIEGLVNTLNQHPDAVTAVPYWKVIFSPESGRIMPMNQYRNNYWFFRVLKFVWKGSVDDSLVYSLHRSDLLKKANPVDHWWPNKGSATNSQDTHLFDLVILGKIIGTPQKDVVWTSHFYTEKSYAIPKNSAKERLKYIILFINIHAVYAFKVYKRCGIFYVLPVVATSCFRLIKPILRHTFSFFRKNFQKLFL